MLQAQITNSALKSSLFFPISAHLPYYAVLHIGLLVATLLTHQSDLKLAKWLRQDVTLSEELPPFNNVSLEEGRVILVTEHPLKTKRFNRRCRSASISIRFTQTFF